MKKQLWILLFALISLTANAQYTIPPKVVRKSEAPLFAARHLNDAPSTNSFSPVRCTNITTNVNFTQFVRTNDGTWKVAGAFTVGNAYMWNFSLGRFNQDSSITIEERFAVGLGYSFGVAPVDSGALSGSLIIGVMLQYTSLGGMIGWDTLNERPIFGVAYNLSGIFKSSTRFTQMPL